MQVLLGRAPALFLALATAMLMPLAAHAHAIIVSSAPTPNATLHAPSFPVLLRFNSRIDRERSRLTLLRADGSASPLPVEPEGGPDTLAAEATDLTPGRYRLRWQVLGVDGHITRGDIPFEIVP